MLPEYEPAELHNSAKPINGFKKHIFKIILKSAFFLGLCALIGYLTFLVFLGCNTDDANTSYTSVSIGAALITFFSAAISLMCIFDNKCKRAYEDSLNIIERKYLDGRKPASWSFLKRSSFFSKAGKINYTVLSAYFKINYGENGKNAANVTIPFLAADMTILSCLQRLALLSKITSQYKEYILELSAKNAQTDNENASMKYYILLDVLTSMNKNILFGKLIMLTIKLCVMFILSSVIFTVLFGCRIF